MLLSASSAVSELSSPSVRRRRGAGVSTAAAIRQRAAVDGRVPGVRRATVDVAEGNSQPLAQRPRCRRQNQRSTVGRSALCHVIAEPRRSYSRRSRREARFFAPQAILRNKAIFPPRVRAVPLCGEHRPASARGASPIVHGPLSMVHSAPVVVFGSTGLVVGAPHPAHYTPRHRLMGARAKMYPRIFVGRGLILWDTQHFCRLRFMRQNPGRARFDTRMVVQCLPLELPVQLHVPPR